MYCSANLFASADSPHPHKISEVWRPHEDYRVAFAAAIVNSNLDVRHTAGSMSLRIPVTVFICVKGDSKLLVSMIDNILWGEDERSPFSSRALRMFMGTERIMVWLTTRMVAF